MKRTQFLKNTDKQTDRQAHTDKRKDIQTGTHIQTRKNRYSDTAGRHTEAEGHIQTICLYMTDRHKDKQSNMHTEIDRDRQIGMYAYAPINKY